MRCVKQQPTRTVAERSAVTGFAMLELIVALSISAILAVFANQELVTRSQESIARGGGVYLNTVAQAAQSHVLMNFDALAQGNNVPGTVNDLAPTLAELIALGRLRAGFPAGMPTRQTTRIDLLRTSCPGAACQITALVCTTTPITLGGGNTRFDLASTMLEVQEGRGGQARFNDGANIRGPAVNVPNPIGNVEGIVCGSAAVDVGMFNSFVRISDTRDPNLQGNLTVAGNTTLNGPTVVNNSLNVQGATTLQNNLTVNGSATVGPCINLAGGAQGRAAFGCANPNDVPAGMVGGVRSADVIAQGSVLASTAPGAFTGANGNYALLTANNGSGVAEIRTSGRSAADRLTPLGQYAIGAVCAAADEGSIARRNVGSGLVTCSNGVWRALSLTASANDPCTTVGQQATDGTSASLICLDTGGGALRYVLMSSLMRVGSVGAGCTVPGLTATDVANSNITLICRVNLSGGVARWMRLQDVTTHLIFVQSTEVGPDAVITKPACNAASGQPSSPIIQMIPKVWGTPDGGQAFFAVDNGASWIVRMKDGTGTTNLQGQPNAAVVVHTYCYYP